MNILLIFLTGTLMGAFNFGFFMLGYYVRSKTDNDSIKLDKTNSEFLKGLMEWQSYGGKQ